MTMKTCCICKQIKPVSEFNKNSSRKDGLQTKCRVCSNQVSKNHYTDNKDYYKLKTSVAKQSIRKRLDEYKSNMPCCDCGIRYDPICMDFDHLQDKEFNIAHATTLGYSWDHVLLEIAKCDLVCSNCHRLRTKIRRLGCGSTGTAPDSDSGI